MKLRVKCVGYKGEERTFTLGKIYEVENGRIVNDNGFMYSKGMTVGQEPSKWFLSTWYTFEIVKEDKKADNGMKVIFNPPATILIMPDGKKYVSKTHNEGFDPEKGLLMCLAKANGITHLELKRMILNGKHPDNIPADEIKERWGK